VQDRSLIMVIGPGRSGTSSMAGTLASCGYHVPQAIKGNESNPSGFFEPRWVVNLHKRLLGRAGVGTLDPDPRALEAVEALNTSQEQRDEVRGWLEQRLDEHPRLVLKDPRMIWFRDLWVSAARDLGVDPGFVVMLRHPSEVSASRSTYYSARDVAAVAGWINVALLSEQLTASCSRKFVHYPDLLGDWRAEVTDLVTSLDILLDPGPEQRPHPVDELIDPTLRRMSVGWDDIAVPQFLSDLADRTFALLHEESRAAGSVGAAQFDEVRREYAELYEFADVIVRSERQRREARIRRRAARRALDNHTAELAASGRPGLLSRLRSKA
jgi:hypothetical protein